MASGLYLDDIAKLVDEGKVRIARASPGISVTCPPSLVTGNAPGVGMVCAHSAFTWPRVSAVFLVLSPWELQI